MADSGRVRLYRRTTGSTYMTGELYEIYMCMLLFVRSKLQTCEFRLATEMEKAGAFDDIVLSLKDKKTEKEKTYFIQIKHKHKKSIIDRRALCAMKGDFSLFKYFRSYLEVKNNFPNDNNVFVIYTNVEMKSRGCVSHDDDLLNSGGKIFTFTQQSEEYNVFKQVETYRNVIQEISDGSFTEDEAREKLKKFEELFPNRRLLRLLNDKEELNMEMKQQTEEWKWETWDEFMKNLKFYTEQSSLENLETLVKNDLEKLCGTSEMFSELKNGIMAWRRETSGFYLTEIGNPFWEDILQQRASALMVAVSNKLSSVSGLKFQKTQYISFTNKVTHIICRGGTELSCLKVQQSLADVKHLFTDKDVLQKRLREVLCLWDHFHILIVDGYSTEINTETYSQLSSVLRTDQDKKIVFLSDNTDLMAVKLSELFPSALFTDIFNIGQLTIDSQNTVLNCEVEFQGKLVKLKTIVVDPDVVTADVTVELLKNKRIQIGCELLPVDDVYISRTFLRHETVCKKIFELTENDCIAFSNVTLSEVISILPENTVVQEFTDADKINTKCRYFIIDGMLSFKSLCKKCAKVHWLEKKDNSFVWRKSSGDITIIKNNLEQNADPIQYEDICQVLGIPEQLVLIVAAAGMGKTIEVTRLAKMYKDKYPSMWVLNVKVNHHAEILVNSAVTAVELLWEAGNLKTIFEKSLFERELFNRGNILVILDGCDEASPVFLGKVIAIVKEIIDTNVSKICVTSRPVIQEDLEKEFSTLAFSLNPLSRENQLELLEKMWMVPKSSSTDMMTFASTLLDSYTKLFDDTSGNMMGTPLHCNMVAEVFREEAQQYNVSGIVDIPAYFDLLKIYEVFVDLKFEVYFVGKIHLNMTNFTIFSMAQDMKKKLIRDISLCALVTFLDEDDFKKLSNSKDLQHRYRTILDKYRNGQDLATTGFIQNIIEDKPVFVHRSIEEYFVALWLSENYHESRELVVDKFFYSDWQAVKSFLDRILDVGFKLHTAILNRDLSTLQQLLESQNVYVNERDVGGRTALHLAVTSRNKDEHAICEKMLSMLLVHGADPNIEDNLCKWRPLMYAEKVRLWSAVEILLVFGADKRDLDVIIDHFNDGKYVDDLLKSSLATKTKYIFQFVLVARDNDGNTLLHYAAEQGNVHAVNVLLSHNVDVNVKNNKMETPAHVALEHKRMEVVKLLLEYSPDLAVCASAK